jgi:hypothetical protein
MDLPGSQTVLPVELQDLKFTLAPIERRAARTKRGQIQLIGTEARVGIA